MINPLQLRTLQTVVRTGSFADAARELGYTPSAVSQQIALLERQVRMTLFERSPRSITPTPMALTIAEMARETLLSLDALDEEIAALAEGRIGMLRVGSFPTASQRILPASISHYWRSHENIRIELDEAEADTLSRQLIDGRVDLALTYRYDLVPRTPLDGLTALPLLDEDLLLLLEHNDPLTERGGICWADVGDRTWVTPLVGTAGTECLQRLCGAAGFEPRIAFRSNDYAVIHEFVRRGLGVALVPALSHTPSPGIKSATVAGLTARRRVQVIRRSRSGNPAVADFIASLQAAAADLVGGHLHLPA